MEKGVYNPEATGTKPVRHLAIDILLIKKAAALLRVVNHKLRQQILLLLHAKGPLSVTQIYTQLRLEQSVASQQLALLRRAGCVHTRREVKTIWYSVDYQRLAEIEQCATDLTDYRK